MLIGYVTTCNTQLIGNSHCSTGDILEGEIGYTILRCPNNKKNIP